MTMHPLYENRLTPEELDAIHGLEDCEWKRKILWWDNCPEWFKPLRDMGITADMWSDGMALLRHTIVYKDTVTAWDISSKAESRLDKMAEDLWYWVESEPK